MNAEVGILLAMKLVVKWFAMTVASFLRTKLSTKAQNGVFSAPNREINVRVLERL